MGAWQKEAAQPPGEATLELRRKLQALRIDKVATPSPAPPREPRAQHRFIIGGLSVALVASLAGNLAFATLGRTRTDNGAARQAAPRAAPAASPVVAAAARIAASGNIRPLRQATVSAEATGRLVDLRVEEGAWVRKGDVLARLDSAVPAASTALAQAQEDAATAALRTSQASLARASAEARRVEALHAKGFSSDAALDLAREAIASAQAQVAQRRAEAAAANSAVRRQASLETQYVIRAPFDGLVVSRNAQLGEIVSPVSAGGGFTRSGVYTVADLSRIEVEARIGEADLPRVRVGAPAQVTFEAYPDRTLQAEVVAISPSAERDRGAVPVRVRVAATEGLKLLPQMAAQIEIRP